jgi:hypothetical protein
MRSSRKATPIRLRKRFSLRFLIVVTLLFGLDFALVAWPMCLLVALAIVVAACMEGLTPVELIVYAGIVLVFAGPSIGHRHSRPARPAVGPGGPTRPAAANRSPAS